MKSSERQQWNLIRRHLPKIKDRFDRVESQVVPGMPDINYCIDGTEGWIELKHPVEPKKDSTKLLGSKNHSLLQSQKNWIHRQRLAGGLVWILLATDKRLILMDGSHAENINEYSLLDMIAYSERSFLKTLNLHDWEILRRILKFRI